MYRPPTMYNPPPTTPNRTFRPQSINSGPQIYSNQPVIPNNEIPMQSPVDNGPHITVFIGNLNEKWPDTMIKKMLSACGNVVNWKRVATFGFCEYDGPVSGGRAVRLLHELGIDDKKLVAKVDAKNKALLDNFKEEETKKSESANSKLSDAASEKHGDNSALDAIRGLLEEYKEELKALTDADHPLTKNKMLLNSVEIEDGKRELISKEIGKFRKYTEEEELKKEKEKDRKKRETEREKDKDEKREKEKEKPSEKEKDKEKSRRSPSPGRKKEKRRSRDREREKEKERQKEKERERDLERQREREERERAREREREREREMRERDREMRDRERERERERERDEPKVKNVKEIQKQKEMEEEARERKRQEKRIREKEAAYQERLRNWEARERRKGKEYEKEREKELLREEEREKEAKCMKEFLEDYEDERDDPKYYKGRELERRLALRLREADADAMDREREQKELDDLRTKIFSGEYDNPTLEFERLKKEREDLYRPKILIDVNLEQSQQREKEIERERARELERQKTRERQKQQKERYVIEQASRELASVNAEPIDSDSQDGSSNGPAIASPLDRPNSKPTSQRGGSESRDSFNNVNSNDDDMSRNSLLSNTPTPNSPSMSNQGSGSNNLLSGTGFSLNLNAKKKKIDVKDVFAMDDEGEEINGPKKRKLVPLDYEDTGKSTKSRKDSETGAVTGATQKKTEEEKRKHIKSIIDKIPTDKNALFNYELDWTEIDRTIEKKVRPWINKKIIEYIGEPEPTLVDFIYSKVVAGSSPQSILDDVQMVLDEEAEVFVVKMWRLLIYEVEAKKKNLKL